MNKHLITVVAGVSAAIGIAAGVASCTGPVPKPSVACTPLVDHDHDCATEPDNDGN